MNTIAPGNISTENTEALRDIPDRPKSLLDRMPTGRWGVPADFGGPAVFPASEASSCMHGHCMTIDGGWMGRQAPVSDP